MKLQVPFIQLPVTFDAAALAAEIDALGESVWRPHPQGFPGNSAVPLVSAHGDPDSDAVSGPMLPTPQLQQCPYLMQVFDTLGATWGRSRLMRLSGQAEVSAHVDIDYYWREHMRVHVPIVTQPEVRFHCGDKAIHMASGDCWIFDTWRPHRVVNSANRSRIHLVADTVGGPGLWNLIAQSRVPEGSPPGWQAQHIAPTDSLPTNILYESQNLPTVMTPWEVREHLTFILDEARPHANLGNVSQLIGHFCRHWRSLWAAWGEAAEGGPAYRDALVLFREELARIATGMTLQNDVRLEQAIYKLVISVALADTTAPIMADERSAPIDPASMRNVA